MSRHLGKVFVAIGATLAAVAMMAPAAQADTPEVGYEQFAGCPSPKTENPTVRTCIRGVVTSGHIRFGKTDMPISIPIGLSGGIDTFGGGFFSSPKGGMESIKEPVPGGLFGGTKLLANLLNLKQLDLYAVTELAGTPGFSPSLLHLPIKVHLINAALGNNCYIGSNANPMVLDLTTGTTSPPPPNKPIAGVTPGTGFEPVREILFLNNGTYVDNSFAAPGATGCVLKLGGGGFSLNVNSLVNSKVGLPAPAGINEAVMNLNAEVASSEFVYP